MTTQQFLTVPLHPAGALAEDQQVGFSTSSSQLRRRLRGAQAGAYCVARIRRDFRCRWHGQRRRHPNSQDSRDSSSLGHQRLPAGRLPPASASSFYVAPRLRAAGIPETSRVAQVTIVGLRIVDRHRRVVATMRTPPIVGATSSGHLHCRASIVVG